MRTNFGSAYAVWEDDLLEVSTGVFSRRWKAAAGGFSTLDMKLNGHLLCQGDGTPDYNLLGLTSGSPCQVNSVDFYIEEDEYSSPRLEVVAMTNYPELELCVKYVIWAYPGAEGLRTQLFVKRYLNCLAPQPTGASVVEAFPLLPEIKDASFFGYHNHTQKRNTFETELIREEEVPICDGLNVSWASGAVLNAGTYGLCIVKENNKCVNQPAYETGEFITEEGRFLCTGAGIRAQDIPQTGFMFAWATWTLGFDNTAGGVEASVKHFDRMRFPVDKSRDIYVMSNTWGSCGLPQSPVFRDVANEASILEELDAAKEIGVEVLQIDDGWNAPYNENGRIESDKLWYVNKEKFPGGWAPIREKAEQCGVTLGLWCAWYVTADEMIENQRQGNFKYFKIDFADLNTRQKFDYLYNKARRLTQGGKIRVNWDVTENPARMGYYFGREFGNIYLENRKPTAPLSGIYTPYLVLRDAWQLSKYTNINKFQLTLQNLEVVDRTRSDAYLHNYRYCTMIACLGAPLLFQELKLLSPEARQEIKKNLDIYKQYREELFDAYAYPVGEKPNNASWTGFQYVANESSGHMIIFREIQNQEAEKNICFRGLESRTLELYDIFDDTISQITTDNCGMATLHMESPCSVRWLKYRTLA